MPDRLQLEIVTPERRVFSDVVDAVTLPALNGEMEILPGHKPLISALKSGVLRYSNGGAAERLVVSGGFVEVNGERVSVLAEMAEKASEVDAARARQERDEAERKLSAPSDNVEDQEQARLALERADARLLLVEGK